MLHALLHLSCQLQHDVVPLPGHLPSPGSRRGGSDGAALPIASLTSSKGAASAAPSVTVSTPTVMPSSAAGGEHK